MLVDISGPVLFIAVCVLLSLLVKLLYWAWRLSVTFCKTKTVDFRQKFGEWAVITGSTDGIGKEYAKELAKRNINVVLVSRSIDKLNKVKNEIQTLSPNVEIKIIQADFSAGRQELDRIETQLADIPVGILVNNVGKISEYPMYFGEISKTELWDTINVNMASTTLMTRLVIEPMKKRGKGAIVNISSGMALFPAPLFSQYSATKIYVRYLTDAIRAEYAKYGLTVQCLTPFYIKTQMVGYSERIQNQKLMCPDPEKFVKSAIETLGKLDSTTGYWSHEIEYLAIVLFPTCLRTKISFLFNRIWRKEYFTTHKKKADE